MAHMRKRH